MVEEVNGNEKRLFTEPPPCADRLSGAWLGEVTKGARPRKNVPDLAGQQATQRACRGGWEGTPAEAGFPQPGPPGPSFRPCSAPRPGQRSRLSAGRCCPLLGDARRPFWRELLGRDPQDWGLGGGGV